MTLAQFGLFRYMVDQGLLPAGVTFSGAVNNGNGTVTVTLTGKALGSWAAPTPALCLIGIAQGAIIVTSTSSPGSSSSGL